MGGTIRSRPARKEQCVSRTLNGSSKYEKQGRKLEEDSC